MPRKKTNAYLLVALGGSRDEDCWTGCLYWYSLRLPRASDSNPKYYVIKKEICTLYYKFCLFYSILVLLTLHSL